MGRARLTSCGLSSTVLPRLTLRALVVELGDIRTGVALDRFLVTVIVAAAGHAI